MRASYVSGIYGAGAASNDSSSALGFPPNIEMQKTRDLIHCAGSSYLEWRVVGTKKMRRHALFARNCEFEARLRKRDCAAHASC
jgi:hypothetical protein